MARSTFTAHFARSSRPLSGRRLRPSSRFGPANAPLGMERTTASTTGAAGEAVVVTGVFEPALSIKELAAQLHVSAQDLRSQGRGPTGFRVGRHLRFRQSEIDAWLSRLEEEDADRHPGSRR